MEALQPAVVYQRLMVAHMSIMSNPQSGSILQALAVLAGWSRRVCAKAGSLLQPCRCAVRARDGVVGPCSEGTASQVIQELLISPLSAALRACQSTLWMAGLVSERLERPDCCTLEVRHHEVMCVANCISSWLPRTSPSSSVIRTLFMTFNGAFIGLVPGELIGDVILLVRKLRGCS